METPTLADAIKELEREQKLREACYPKWVREKRLSQERAGWQLACSWLALENLRDLQRHTTQA